jgi:molecular chaperone DnaJ
VARLRGEGPPRAGGKGNSDIHYRFVIDVPQKLSKEQEKAVEELSKALGGDPRAGLFENGSAPHDAASAQGAAKAGES